MVEEIYYMVWKDTRKDPMIANAFGYKFEEERKAFEEYNRLKQEGIFYNIKLIRKNGKMSDEDLFDGDRIYDKWDPVKEKWIDCLKKNK